MDQLPTIHRPINGRLQVWMPWKEGGNIDILRDILGTRVKTAWFRSDPKNHHWALSRHHLRPIVTGVASRFPLTQITLDFRRQQTCGKNCHRAKNDDCTCSCFGARHGGGTFWHQLPIRELRTFPTDDGTIRRIYLARNFSQK
ncbi:MAG: hypothetical protein HOQ05_12380 [Corynebacteriales bacterium]|nr:hypothetical protein [Mycobacteriales bacterium]